MILYNIIYIHTVYIIYIYIVSCKVVSQGSPCCSWNPLGGLLEMARNWKFASKAILPLGSARILMIFLRRAIWSRNSFFFEASNELNQLCDFLVGYIPQNTRIGQYIPWNSVIRARQRFRRFFHALWSVPRPAFPQRKVLEEHLRLQCPALTVSVKGEGAVEFGLGGNRSFRCHFFVLCLEK